MYGGWIPQDIYVLATPSQNGGTLEMFSVVGGVAAGVVLERDVDGPKLWESFDGSLWRTDSSGRPVKLRDKWG